eukprot:jgi/Ulvmu1/7465/UM037_0008.1
MSSGNSVFGVDADDVFCTELLRDPREATSAHVVFGRRPSPHPNVNKVEHSSCRHAATARVFGEPEDRLKHTTGFSPRPIGVADVSHAIFILCASTVGLLTAGALCLWTASNASSGGMTPHMYPMRGPQSLRPQPTPQLHQVDDAFPFPAGITGALDVYTDTHIVFSSATLSTTPDASNSPTPSEPGPLIWAAVNKTFSPASAATAVALNIPPDTMQTLQRIRIFGVDHCNDTVPPCICGPSAARAALPAALRSAPPPVCGRPCSEDTLEPLALPAARVYEEDDWFVLRMPCMLRPGNTYTIEWLAAPENAVLESAPYDTSAAGGRGRCTQGAALSVTLLDIVPSCVARGSDTGTARIVVTAPVGVTVLSSAEASAVDAETMHDDGTRTVVFEPLQGISADMLGVTVGMLTRLATGRDATGRRVSVWALPGAMPEDTLVPWQLLSNATAAWADFTGQPLPSLGKLDMVVWNGEAPWSTAQHGLLLMDRFRTLWRGGASTATDLVRAAHVICHETGHLWIGGLLQTLDTEEISFVQEGTTSYGEVYCVSKVLPGPLSTLATFTRAFFPEFGETRALHTGAEFHATATLAQPASANETILDGRTALYTKGPALLHMLGSYMDTTARKGLMRRTMQAFFHTFAGTAVTTQDLLCHLAHALSGCSIDATYSHHTCFDSGGPPRLTALPHVPASPSPAGGCVLAPVWKARLQAWLEEPGVPVVEVHRHAVAAGGPVALQAKLLPNGIPGQAPSTSPLWVPLSLVHSEVARRNATTRSRGLTWLTVFPPGASQHSTDVGGEHAAERACSESAASGLPACSRPLASARIEVMHQAGAWLPKPTAGPFLVSMPDKGMQAAVVRQLRQFKLSGGGLEVGAAHPDLPALQAFSTLLHDTHTLFTAAPTPPRYAFLRELLAAAFAAPAASQPGLGAYLLLGPATAALWELQLLARGNQECVAKVGGLEAEAVGHVGRVMWDRLASCMHNNIGGPNTWTQGELFSRSIAARIVPLAARHNPDLAAALCEQVEPVHSNATLADVMAALPGPPEVQNVVFEAAVAMAESCTAGAAVEQLMLKYLQNEKPTLMPHLRRSATFMLASSGDKAVLEFLVDAAVLDQVEGVDAGLRDSDRVLLLQRIVRNSVAGFRAAAGRLQRFAEDVGDWEWEGTVRDMAPWAAVGLDLELPEWLPVEQIDPHQRRPLEVQKHSDMLAAQIVCGVE